MSKNIIQQKDSIITLFCLIDEICKKILPRELPKKAGRKSALGVSELMAIAVIFLYSDCNSFKGFYRIFQHTNFFPNLPEYSRLLKNVKSISPHIVQILHILTAMNRAKSDNDVMFVDSMPLPVVNNKRIFNYKTTGLAKRGRSSMGWFYGFKMHLIINKKGELLRVKITSGNVSDKDHELIMELFENLKGMVIADAGYTSEALRKKLFEKGIHLFACPYKNMKKLMTKAQHKLLKSRQLIETVNGCIKHRTSCVSSLPRSFDGYMWRYLTAVFAFVLTHQAF